MSAHREEHIDLCAGWALETLDPQDLSRLEDHLASGCAKCAKALSDFGDAAVLLAASAPPAMPSAALRARVLAAMVEDTAPAKASGKRAAPGAERAAPAAALGRVIEMRPRRGGRIVASGFAAVAAAFAVTSVIALSTSRRLESELATNRQAFTDLEQKLAAERVRGAVLDILDAPGARVAVLAPIDSTLTGVSARATYDPATQRAVVVFRGLKAPSGHDFELWAIRGATPASLGVIKVDDSGHALFALENVGDPATLNAFAVSLEAVGGSPTHDKPSGPVVMVGKLEG